MPYDVEMRRNATGEVRRIALDFEWEKDGGTDLYWWTDGNFGCDSNRILVWTDWGRTEPFDSIAEMPKNDGPDEIHYCDTGHFTVIKAILPDGREIPIDDSAANDNTAEDAA